MIESDQYLSAFNADDSVEVAIGVVKEANADRLSARRNPWPLGLRVDMEDMGFGGENGLFSVMDKTIF